MEFYFRTVAEIEKQAGQILNARKVEYDQVHREAKALARDLQQNPPKTMDFSDSRPARYNELSLRLASLTESVDWLNSILEQCEKAENKETLIELNLRDLHALGFEPAAAEKKPARGKKKQEV